MCFYDAHWNYTTIDSFIPPDITIPLTGTKCFSYGANGNHTKKNVCGNSYTLSYDANGNQTSRTVGGSSYSLSYDAENHLVSVSGAATASFVYDGDGNRVKGTVAGVTTAYVGNYFEWTGSTSTMKKYYYAGNTRVAMRTGSSTLNFLLGDHLGSQSITTNSSGAKTGEIRYYPWGTERCTYGTTPTTYHFTGQRLESSIGLYYYGARWYDPSLGRFIQADSIVPSGIQGLDRYAYVLNNPLKYVDPSGNFTQPPTQDLNETCGPDNYKCGGLKEDILYLTPEGQRLIEFVEMSEGQYSINDVIQMGFVGEVASWYINENLVSYDAELVGVRYQWYRINKCGGIDSWICRVNYATTFESVNNVVNGYWFTVEQAIIDYRVNADPARWNAAGKMLNAILYPKPEWSEFNNQTPPNSLPNNWNLAFDLGILSIDYVKSIIGNRDPIMGVNGDFLYFEKVIYKGEDSLSVILTVRQWKIWFP